MSSNEIIRDTISALRDAGFRPTIEGGKHFKVRWSDHTGRPRMLIVSRSPSDFRAKIQNRMMLRRLLRS
jgi:hypothetical protein